MSETGNSPDQAEPEGALGDDDAELRRVLEEQMRTAQVGDLVIQSVVGIVNLTARRIGIEEERDLDQAKLGIDAVRALVDLLPAELAGQVRDALSQLQLQYAQLSGGAAPGPPDSSPATETPKSQGSGLWTPPGSS